MYLLLTESYYNIHIRGVISSLFIAFIFLLCSPLSAAENSNLNTPQATLSEVKALLDKQISEWNQMKPALQRLIKSEQDLALIVAALDKASPLASKPNEEQLLTPKPLTLKKELKKEEKITNKAPNTSDFSKSKIARVKKVTQLKATQSAQSGIHLASYKKASNVAQGWSVLKSQFGTQLEDKSPFYYQINIENITYTRLVVGEFSSNKEAAKTCSRLKEKKQFCQVIKYALKDKK